MKKATRKPKYNRTLDISWDFKGENTKQHTHCFHQYPAMFIPQVANRLIDKYSNENDRICDIFCGSGTAMIEAKLLNRKPVGIDLNPFAIFLAKTKSTPIKPKKIISIYSDLLSSISRKRKIKIPKFNNIDFWFKENIIFQLAKIKEAIKEIENKKIQNFFMVAFSDTVRKSSNTKNGEFKLVRIKPDKLENHNPNVEEIFRKNVEKNISGMSQFYKDLKNKRELPKIIFGDSSKENGIDKESIDLIITSPPYGDSRTTVAYGQFSRLSSQWLDLFEDPNEASSVDNKLLGGIPVKDLLHELNSHYLSESINEIKDRDEKRAREVLSFYIGLNDCIKQAHRILKKNKYFCVVIGNRQVKQVRIPTDFIIAELSEKIGFKCEEIIVRNIPGKRMPIKNSPTNIPGKLEETMNIESIVILKKVK